PVAMVKQFLHSNPSLHESLMKNITRIIVICALALIGQSTFAQTYNKSFKLSYGAMGANSLVHDTSSNTLISQYTCINTNGNQKVGYIRLNIHSDVLQFTESSNNIPANVGAYNITSSNGYFYSAINTGQLFFYLSKYDKNTLIDSVFPIQLNTYNNAILNIKTVGGNLILLGYKGLTYNGNTGRPVCLIVDTNGIIINQVGINTNSYDDYYFDYHYANDEHWLFRSEDDGDNSDEYTYSRKRVERYDSLWNQLQVFHYYDENGLQNSSAVVAAPTDSSFIITSAYGVESEPSLNDNQNPALFEIDFNGNVIWDFKDSNGYFPAYFNSFSQVEIDDAGNFYALGEAYCRHDSTDLRKPAGNEEVWKYIQQAILYKWNKHHELQWARHIKHPEAKSFNSISSPHQMVVLEDHSIVLAGDVIPGAYDSLDNQQYWIVKTDSNGCVDGYPCTDWATVGIEDKVTPNYESFEVYPNPASSSQIYTDMQFSPSNTVSIVPVGGGIVVQGKFEGKQLSIPNQLNTGTYILMVWDKGQLYSSKIILQ
ncbi:MAG: hypothetical protein CL843_07825, partial [Crocinitomicaceae bacterium]|nr:hypothetical protein [Crocinitomicaceae bacterium]